MTFASCPDHSYVRFRFGSANVWISNLEADMDDMWSFVVHGIGWVEERGYPADV
jgi:hypothetical protein